MHHSRRRSGHASTNSSTTDVRKVGTTSDVSKPRRPQTLTRKSTPQTVLKLGKNPRDREREWEEERWVEDERESFPQFCLASASESPFDLDAAARFAVEVVSLMFYLTSFCAWEGCRERDQNASVRAASSHHPSRGHDGFGANFPYYSVGNSEPRDIIPRASPSRWSPPTTPTTGQYTNAVSALRSLSIRPVSPTSPIPGNVVWPFTRSAVTSPSTSYTKSANNFYSSTYDNGYAVTSYGYAQGGMTDRPLPSRKPGAYSRPKSIELVTPIVGR
ncbi:hypothetical protein Daesc_008428 [Daldinia eschscholtzii]|uniref:Uncharacterized protein n=1 Tax=Daldinia eschscholtzii TaxID=292717 RepID=A0AAX6MD26_9PEZI